MQLSGGLSMFGESIDSFFKTILQAMLSKNCFSTGYTDSSGEYVAQLSEHYFLTDPDEFIYTHFPHIEGQPEYERSG